MDNFFDAGQAWLPFVNGAIELISPNVLSALPVATMVQVVRWFNQDAGEFTLYVGSFTMKNSL